MFEFISRDGSFYYTDSTLSGLCHQIRQWFPNCIKLRAVNEVDPLTLKTRYQVLIMSPYTIGPNWYGTLYPA